jgi:formate transporter
MADHGTRRLQRLSVVQILVLAMLAGGFVTVGALFSVLLATGIGSPGAQRLVEGLGFSAGFFSSSFLTRCCSPRPTSCSATILRCHGSPAARLATIARFWALVWAGNLAGAFLVGYAIHLGLHYPPDVGRLRDQVVARKMATRPSAVPAAGGRWCCRGCWPTGWSAWPPSSR